MGCKKKCNFAAAMPSGLMINVDLRALSQLESPQCLTLEDKFFLNLDQEEILGGKLKAELSAKERTSGVFELEICVSGLVKVVCDRCLDEATLPIEAKDTIKICEGLDMEEEGMDSEVRMLLGRGYEYDVTWDLYEIIAVALPLQKVHMHGECNPEMLQHVIIDDEISDIN